MTYHTRIEHSVTITPLRGLFSNPINPEIKDTTYTARSATHIDLHLQIDSEDRIRTKLNTKRDDVNFPVHVIAINVRRGVHIGSISFVVGLSIPERASASFTG
jgi:hypothetical protein